MFWSCKLKSYGIKAPGWLVLIFLQSQVSGNFPVDSSDSHSRDISCNGGCPEFEYCGISATGVASCKRCVYICPERPDRNSTRTLPEPCRDICLVLPPVLPFNLAGRLIAAFVGSFLGLVAVLGIKLGLHIYEERKSKRKPEDEQAVIEQDSLGQITEFNSSATRDVTSHEESKLNNPKNSKSTDTSYGTLNDSYM